MLGITSSSHSTVLTKTFMVITVKLLRLLKKRSTHKLPTNFLPGGLMMQQL